MSIYNQVNKPALRRPVELGLAAGVAVVHELDLVDPLGHGEGHPERVEDEVGAHVRRELPADHLAAVSVDHEREEDEALPAAQIGEVRDPVQPL